ncbi:MAG TPA: S1C family serine protease [Gaiellaceae bacterium]|jgi:S1-C subfamily serine protease|nr:S1C family serine protease [Gaiellaceae bacterium]
MKALAVLALVIAVAGGGWAYRHERDQRRTDVARLGRELRVVRGDLSTAERQNEVLAGRLRGVTRRARKARLARTTLAARVRRSVFTVTASLDEGSGFVAWVKGRDTYVMTANHVVVLSVHRHELGVRVHSGTRVWLGRIVRTDPDNDLALIRVPRRIGPPLWQRPVYVPPLVGDELLLVGSPLGYEGSVTSGVVGRVAYNEIQTDAAAYPGISGGPVVDEDGRVVGVLVSGEAENLNFAVPIDRACLKLRPCKSRGRKARGR